MTVIKDNHLKLYYEKIGQGPDLVMLHGNGEDHTTLMTLAFALKSDFTIYLIDSRGHGQSTGGIAKDYQEMSIDFIEFLNQQKIYKTSVLGYSDGAIIALKSAVMQPDRFDKLILCGLNISPDGLIDDIIKDMKCAYEKNKDPKLALMLEGPVFKPFDLEKVNHEVLLIFGENDLIKKQHQADITTQLSHASLYILKGETHSSYIMDNVMLVPLVMAFLKPTKSS